MRERDAAFAAFSIEWHITNRVELEGELTPEQEAQFSRDSAQLVAEWNAKVPVDE